MPVVISAAPLFSLTSAAQQTCAPLVPALTATVIADITGPLVLRRGINSSGASERLPPDQGTYLYRREGAWDDYSQPQPKPALLGVES